MGSFSFPIIRQNQSGNKVKLSHILARRSELDAEAPLVRLTNTCSHKEDMM